MKLKWIAHSCFEIELKNGKKIATDPFDGTIGYNCPTLTPDIALISHDHFDHNDVTRLAGDYKLVREAGVYDFGDVKITAIHCYHDDQKGALRGDNLIFVIEADAMRVVHMGDLGEMPSEELYNAIGKPDILLIPVGGVFTVDGNQAYEICGRLEPNLIIPMHYKTPTLTTPLDGVQVFLNANKGGYDVSVRGSSTLEIDASSLKKRTRVFVMQPDLD